MSRPSWTKAGIIPFSRKGRKEASSPLQDVLLTRTNFGRFFPPKSDDKIRERRVEKLLPNMMQQQPGQCGMEQGRQMPALLHNIKAAINNNPSFLAVQPHFQRRKEREKGRGGKSYAKFHVRARVWTSSNLRHLHSCRRQGSTQEWC